MNATVDKIAVHLAVPSPPSSFLPELLTRAQGVYVARVRQLAAIPSGGAEDLKMNWTHIEMQSVGVGHHLAGDVESPRGHTVWLPIHYSPTDDTLARGARAGGN